MGGWLRHAQRVLLGSRASRIAGAELPGAGLRRERQRLCQHLLYSASRPALRLLTDTLLDSLARAGIESFALEITSYEGA